MRLHDFFDESIKPARKLVDFYDELDFEDKRPRSEWRDKLFGNSIVSWGMREGVWRSISSDKRIQIVGAESRKEFRENIKNQRLMLLQYALVMMLAAIDKLLHEATTSRNFVQLLKSGKLDALMKNFPASETYDIAMESRIRTGHGGKRKRRPANKIKEIVSAKLYELSFLATSNLEQICAANGVSSVFSKYATSLSRRSPEPLKNQWSLIYQKRNAIVHECNIIRTKISPKKIQFKMSTSAELKRDIDFAEKFGKFLASKLG